jgi:hypothetical protein
MIQVNRLGTLGNNMWQYAFSRVIAEENNLKLDCYSIPGFPKTLEKIDGNVFSEPVITIHGHYINLEEIDSNCRIEMSGYVQRYEYIKNHKQKVKEWFQLDVNSPIEVLPDDFVVSIRRGWNGYPTSMCPPKEFFIEVFEKVSYNRIILCTDTFDDPFFDFMNSLGVEVIKAKYSILEQFALIMSANKILLTPSTYCWWAAFLSNASEIYYPWTGDLIPTEKGPNLWVDDEDRYIAIKNK